jgi:xylan 1,4-beta-xylosidase
MAPSQLLSKYFARVSCCCKRIRWRRILVDMMRIHVCFAVFVSFAFPLLAPAAESFPVSISVDASKPLGELKPIWRMFGADEPNYTTMKNGRKLTRHLGQLKPKDVYFRAHNLLTSGDGTASLKWGSTGVYSEDADGKAIYNWKILDEIFDTYLTNGVRPYAQIGFMPEALSTKPHPYRHNWNPSMRYNDIYTGWAYPPKDYDKWRELVFQWVKHCVERYGKAEVETWYWQVWNEANIGYWKGTQEEFLKLHDYAIDGVRRALPTARVGGADSAGSGGRWTRNFIEHCLRGTNFATGKIGTPLGFVSFHAKGGPVYTNDHVRMGIATHLRTIEDGFKIVASYPELKNTPIVIGESDPEGCAACQGPQLGYRNGTMYSSYTAATFARKWELARASGVNLDAALTWAFTFEDQPLFAGFRQIATGGIDLPVLNVFRMFSQVSGQQLTVQSDSAISLDEIKGRGVRDKPDVSAIAALDKNKLSVLAWHYHDDDVQGPNANVTIKTAGVPQTRNAKLTRYLIDSEHSNSFAVWKKIGSPQQPTAEQYAHLEKAGALAQIGSATAVALQNGELKIDFTLERQGVMLMLVTWD